MKNEITIYDIKVPTKREEVSNEENIKQLLANIDKLKDNVLTFDTKEQIKESKRFKTDANKFISDFKKFCDPLEEEGKTIAQTRSKVKLALEKIVDDKLAPIVEREKKLQTIKDNLFIPSSDAKSCEFKLASLKTLDGYEWFGLADEALPATQQSKVFFENELLGFEKAAKEKLEAEEKLRIERENLIKEQAKLDEANKRAEQAYAKIATQTIQEAIKKDLNTTFSIVDHQARIRNEILDDLDFYIGDRELRKAMIKAIANGKIRNLKIIY